MKKKLFTVMIALLLAVATPLTFATMLSGCKKADPTEEYIALESSAMHGMINNMFENAAPSTDLHATANVEVTLSDLFFTIMGNEDLNWIDSVSANFDLHQNEFRVKTLADISMNSKSLFSYTSIADTLIGKTYISIPTISDEYVKTDDGAVDGTTELKLALARLDTPETEVAKALLIKYVDVALKNMVNIEKTTETLNIKGVTQEVNVYTNCITEKVFLDAFKAILTEAKNDSQLKAIFPDEVNWEAAIDEAIASLNEQTPSDNKDDAIVLITYADKDNNVLGRKFSAATFSFSHIELPTGSGSVSETFIGNETDNFRLEGVRTANSSTYTLFITSAEQSIEIGTMVFSGSKKAGTCQLTLSNFVEQNLFGSADADIALNIQWNITDNGTAFDAYLSMASQQVIAVKVNTSPIASENVILPNKAVDINSPDQMEMYTNSISTYELMNNMLAIGFPSEYIDAVINALEGTPAE